MQDLEPYGTDRRHAFNGRGLAYVRATQPGRLTVSAVGEGLRAAMVAIEVRRGTSAAVIPPAR